jgi:hypothetical protein
MEKKALFIDKEIIVSVRYPFTYVIEELIKHGFPVKIIRKRFTTDLTEKDVEFTGEITVFNTDDNRICFTTK